MGWKPGRHHKEAFIEDFKSRPTIRGLAGEFVVAKILNNLKRKYGIKFIRSFVIPNSENVWNVQLDILALTRKGFFVIEVKNWNCDLICGDADDLYWVAQYGTSKYPERNPILQNAWHVKKLSYLTESEYSSLICICNNCNLLGKPHENMITYSQIDEYLDKLPDIYTDEEIALEYEELSKIRRYYESII